MTVLSNQVIVNHFFSVNHIKLSATYGSGHGLITLHHIE
jgi:hypothetical protein